MVEVEEVEALRALRRLRGGQAVFGFEKLAVWQMAIEYADEVYSKTESFPDSERFGLTSQLRRAAVSVSSNIAEGSGRNSNQEFVRFIQIAYGSLLETVSQLTIAKRRRYLSDDSFGNLYNQAEQLSISLSRLRTSLHKDSSQPPQRT